MRYDRYGPASDTVRHRHAGPLDAHESARHFSGSTPTPPPPPPPPPKKTDAEIQSELAEQRKRYRAKKGRASTILTGGDSSLGGEEEKLG